MKLFSCTLLTVLKHAMLWACSSILSFFHSLIPGVFGSGVQRDTETSLYRVDRTHWYVYTL